MYLQLSPTSIDGLARHREQHSRQTRYSPPPHPSPQAKPPITRSRPLSPSPSPATPKSQHSKTPSDPTAAPDCHRTCTPPDSAYRRRTPDCPAARAGRRLASGRRAGCTGTAGTRGCGRSAAGSASRCRIGRERFPLGSACRGR